LYEHEKSADEKIRKLSNAVEQSPCTVIITDTKGNIEYVNPKFYQLTGYAFEEVIGKTPSLLKSGKTSHEEYKRLWETITSGSEWRGILCNKKKSGEYYWESISISPIKDLKGTITNFVAVKEDITERKIADERIKASLKEKEVLLKEIHHRVKNNMQIMASLLRLQSEGIKDKHLLDLFNESQNRIKSMALIHEDLYQGKDLARIDFDQYTRKLTGRLMKSFGVDPNRIITSTNIDNVFLGVDTAIPCGLIINELFTNSMKYAFPLDKFKDKKGQVRIDCHSNNAEYTLVFSDNGVGLPEDIDFHKAETMGLDLIRTLVGQLGGNIELNRNNGTEFTITFTV
jgi:PAS domain S-box-containing protein